MISDSRSEKRYILLGIAVDVSGSMKQSIKNKDNQNDNGFTAFRNSLKDLSKKIKQEAVVRKNDGIIVSIDVFAQAFGLKEIENCDLLTLIEFGQESVETQKVNSPASSAIILSVNDPYNELKSIALKNGLNNSFTHWIKKTFSDTDEVHRLVTRLNEYPRFAEHLTRLFPKDWIEVGYESIFSNQNESKLEKAISLVHKFANASKKEIYQIVISEIGDQIIKELPKRGNRLKPLEEVANILESKEDEIENLESLIYGNTPMRGTLQVIQERFKKELQDLPEDTTSILFIVSDGEPTDGDPLMYANQLKDSGINIVSCFLTNQNITDSRKLFNEVELQWSKGAQLMFNMASSVDRKSVFVESLIEKEWEIPSHPRLFVQVNHTDLLNEFTQIIVSLCKEKV